MRVRFRCSGTGDPVPNTHQAADDNDDDNADNSDNDADDADDGVAVAVAILSPAHTWCPSRSWTRVARVARGSLGKVLLTSSTTVSYSLFSNDIHFHHILRPEVGCIE